MQDERSSSLRLLCASGCFGDDNGKSLLVVRYFGIHFLYSISIDELNQTCTECFVSVCNLLLLYRSTVQSFLAFF